MKLTKQQLKRMIKEELLREAVDSEPNADWAKYGVKVDEFINETIKEATKLYDEGEEMLFGENKQQDKHDVNKSAERYEYVSERLAFCKQLIGKLSQRFEALRKQ